MNKRNLLLFLLMSVVGLLAMLWVGLLVRSSPRVPQPSVVAQRSVTPATSSTLPNIAEATPTGQQIMKELNLGKKQR